MRTLPFALARRPWRAGLAAALVALGALSCSSATTARPAATYTADATNVFPGRDWERVPSAAAAGWSQAGLDSVRAKLSTLPTTGFMAVVNGRVLMEYGDITQQSYLASIRKSVLSMLYGIAQEKGEVHLDRTLAENGIDDVGGLTPEEKQATTRDLLGARSGVYHEASNGGDDLASEQRCARRLNSV